MDADPRWAGARLVADALAGDAAALRRLVDEDRDGALAHRHRAGSPLYLRALEGGLAETAPGNWRAAMAATAARYLVLGRALERIAAALATVGVEWLPIKGYDLATRVYDQPEERPTSDLDLLIAAADLEPARAALRAAGWRDLMPGRRAERYRAEEGYAWQARDDGGTLLEVHFRLWGSVPEEMAAAIVGAATPDPGLPPGGRRLALADAFLLAAVHVWMVPLPRGAVAFWDLARIAARGSGTFADEVVAGARRWDLQLPTAAAAAVAAALWSDPVERDPVGRDPVGRDPVGRDPVGRDPVGRDPVGGDPIRSDTICASIARALRGELAAPEKLGFDHCRRRPFTTPLGTIATARLLAGRRSRHGWRGVLRRLWAHPGIVECTTPEDWPWPARRLWHQLDAAGLRRPARTLERFFHREPRPSAAERRVER